MSRTALLIGLALTLAGGPLAQAACTRPVAPVNPDPATATLDRIVAAKNQVAAFIADSDAYQTCMLDDIKAQKDAAKKSKIKFDKAVDKAAQAEIDANQADKEAAGTGFNALVKAYKAAHPS